MDIRLKQFVELFNNKDFFVAHEVLEDLWIETEGEQKDFYKGLIQCSVAFVHLERGNYKGAKKLYRTSCEYLNRYPGVIEEIDVDRLLTQFHNFFAKVVPEAEAQGITMDLETAKTPRM